MLNVYLFNLKPGVLIKTLSHIWGKLNLPTLLFRVGLLTLIKMDSLVYIDVCLGISRNPSLFILYYLFILFIFV